MIESTTSPMTPRERLYKVLHHEKPDRVPLMDFGYWPETLQAWHKQGLPRHITTDFDLEVYLGLEGEARIASLPVINGLFPVFEYKVLKDKGDRIIFRDEEGNICENLKSPLSIPRYIKHGLQTRQDWEYYKREKLDYTRSERIGDVKKAVADAHNAGMPIRFHAGSLYGWLRNWMGLEHISITVLTDREWIEEMMDHLMEMAIYLIEKTFEGIEVDVAWWWEDMCYNRGPLLSPAIFNEIMVPRYQEITQTLRRYNVDVNILDCDGRIYELVPGWLDGGINCMFPIEAIHTDPLILRETYGQDILLMGGVDKRALIKGKDAIRAELGRLHPLVQQGGYIPTVDHRVPPDVSFENYLYYLEQKKQML